MVDIVHTADVHLAEGAPERTEALRAVLETAETAGAAVVTIGGDLFHEPLDVDAIRPQLRDSFADRDVEVVVIPGNHDRAGFRGNTFFGDNVTTLLEEPFEHLELDEVPARITGLPFVERPDDELLVALANRDPFDGTEILLVHCTLDIGISRAATGGEDERRYFPITSQQLAELGFDYVLAGHFHQPRHERLSTGEFVYPGTPASTTSSETGARTVATLDIGTDRLGFKQLETFHHAEETFEVLPGDETTLFEAIEAWATDTRGEKVEARAIIEGFHELDENTFADRLAEVSTGVSTRDKTLTVQDIQRHGLYQAFDARLSEMDWDDETIESVRRRALQAFIRARGEL